MNGPVEVLHDRRIAHHAQVIVLTVRSIGVVAILQPGHAQGTLQERIDAAGVQGSGPIGKAVAVDQIAGPVAQPVDILHEYHPVKCRELGGPLHLEWKRFSTCFEKGQSNPAVLLANEAQGFLEVVGLKNRPVMVGELLDDGLK